MDTTSANNNKWKGNEANVPHHSNSPDTAPNPPDPGLLF